jgi:hypothetical protein
MISFHQTIIGKPLTQPLGHRCPCNLNNWFFTNVGYIMLELKTNLSTSKNIAKADISCSKTDYNTVLT